MCSGLEEYVKDLWASLEEREDIIEEYAIQRQSDEAHRRIRTLEEELRQRETDCAQQSYLFHQSEDALRQRQASIENLQIEIKDLERAQAASLLQSENLEQLREEHARLKDEAATQAALASDLQNQLRQSNSTMIAQDTKHEKDTEELQRRLEQRVAEAKAAQIQAVEAAQREALVKMNEVKTDLESRLGQALEERTTLQTEIDAAKQKIQPKDNEGSKSSEKFCELEAELQTAQAEVSRSREEASKKDTEQQAAIQDQLKLIESLQSQLVISGKKFANLADNARAYDAAAQTVLGSLKQWTQDCAAIQEIASKLRKSKDKDVVPIDPKFRPLIQIQLLQKAVVQYCQTQTQAAETLSGGQALAANTETQPMLWSGLPTTDTQKIGSRSLVGSLLDRVRRVTIRSPSSNAPSPNPPSVEMEQGRRRLADPPTSIMKYVPPIQQLVNEGNHPRETPDREISARSGDVQNGLQKGSEATIRSRSSIFNRGPYNRLVSGSNPRAEVPKVAKREDTVQEDASIGNQVAENNVADAMLNGGDRKRKGLSSSEPSSQDTTAPTKRARATLKMEKPIVSTPHSSPLERANGAEVKRMPNAPRRASHRFLDNGDEPSSPTRASQHFQHGSQDGVRRSSWEGRTPQLARNAHLLDGSQDPLSRFYWRRHSSQGNEESQNSITQSQDVEDGNQAHVSMMKRFHMGA